MCFWTSSASWEHPPKVPYIRSRKQLCSFKEKIKIWSFFQTEWCGFYTHPSKAGVSDRQHCAHRGAEGRANYWLCFQMDYFAHSFFCSSLLHSALLSAFSSIHNTLILTRQPGEWVNSVYMMSIGDLTGAIPYTGSSLLINWKALSRFPEGGSWL